MSGGGRDGGPPGDSWVPEAPPQPQTGLIYRPPPAVVVMGMCGWEEPPEGGWAGYIVEVMWLMMEVLVSLCGVGGRDLIC